MGISRDGGAIMAASGSYGASSAVLLAVQTVDALPTTAGGPGPIMTVGGGAAAGSSARTSSCCQPKFFSV